MTIKVTEEMRQAALRELRGELTDEELSALHLAAVENFEAVEIPGQERPDWEQISIELERLLTPSDPAQLPTAESVVEGGGVKC